MGSKSPIEKTFNKFTKFNSQMKEIFSLYYISLDGNVYGKSLAPYSESIVVPKSGELDIIPFTRAIISPLKLYEILKSYKVSKSTFTEDDSKICGTCDIDDCEPFTIDRMIANGSDDTMTKNDIFQSMYKKMDVLSKGISMYTSSNPDVYTLSEDELFYLLNAAEVIIDYKEIYIIASKKLFPLLNKNSKINVMYICDNTQDIKGKRYVLIHQEEPNMDIYSVMAFMIINK